MSHLPLLENDTTPHLKICNAITNNLADARPRPVNKLGTPGGGEKFSERYPNFLNYVQ